MLRIFPASKSRNLHRDLARIHHWLGSFPTIERFLRKDDKPVRRIVDIGCGDGRLLAYLRERMGVDVIGVDPQAGPSGGHPDRPADATRDLLPEADIAVSFAGLASPHARTEHRHDSQRGRYARRFIILDLIRHPLPLSFSHCSSVR